MNMLTGNRIYPTEIKREEENGIIVQWSDGNSMPLSGEMLRENCPCAYCKEARGDTSHARPLSVTKDNVTTPDASFSSESNAHAVHTHQALSQTRASTEKQDELSLDMKKKYQKSPASSLLKIVKSEPKEEQIKIKKIWSIGQYAVGIEWGDKHNTGIYTFEYLRELGGKM
jgi:DUF971 family protein